MKDMLEIQKMAEKRFPSQSKGSVTIMNKVAKKRAYWVKGYVDAMAEYSDVLLKNEIEMYELRKVIKNMACLGVG